MAIKKRADLLWYLIGMKSGMEAKLMIGTKLKLTVMVKSIGVTPFPQLMVSNLTLSKR